MKTFLKILLIILLIIAVGAGVGYYYLNQQLEADFPEPSGEFEMQGVMWSTNAYYDSPLSYYETYNFVSNALTISSAKKVGANWVLMKAFYSGSGEGEVIGDDELLEKGLREAITQAHEYGLDVFLVPFVDSHDYWVTKDWTLEPDTWTPYVLKWAEFAEDNNVEMFAPGIEMNLIFSDEQAGPWFQEILPQIREVYSGTVATAEHPYLEVWPALVSNDAFDGYDCIGMTLFPWIQYGNMIDILSYEEYMREVDAKIERLNNAAERFEIDCQIVAPLGMDYWRGEWPTAKARSEAYSQAMDAFREDDIDGVFLHIWYKDGKTQGLYSVVGEMVRERWAVE